MANICYIRCSSEDQNTERQHELFKGIKIDQCFEEKVSGKNIKDRPELIKMMNYLRNGDTLYVESISRFGRSLHDLIDLIEQLNEKGVKFKSLKEGDFDTTTPQGKLIFSIFSSLAEFERETIRERQAEGIAIAKKEGKYKGRAKIEYDEDEFIYLYKKWQEGEMKKSKICEKLNMSLPTLDRRIKEYRDKNKNK